MKKLKVDWTCTLLDLPNFDESVLLYSEKSGIRVGKINKVHPDHHAYIITFDNDPLPIDLNALGVLFWAPLPMVPDEFETNQAIMTHALEGSSYSTKRRSK